MLEPVAMTPALLLQAGMGVAPQSRSVSSAVLLDRPVPLRRQLSTRQKVILLTLVALLVLTGSGFLLFGKNGIVGGNSSGARHGNLATRGSDSGNSGVAQSGASGGNGNHSLPPSHSSPTSATSQGHSGSTPGVNLPPGVTPTPTPGQTSVPTPTPTPGVTPTPRPTPRPTPTPTPKPKPTPTPTPKPPSCTNYGTVLTLYDGHGAGGHKFTVSGNCHGDVYLYLTSSPGYTVKLQIC
jgi:hypothetical protein